MQKPTKQDVQIHELTEGAHLICTPQGNVLFGCPPEILKRILASHLPMPDTVVLPDRLHHENSSQASLEFPLYHFLFVQRGLERKRQFQVVANSRQSKGLAELLRITVVGPTAEEMKQAGTAPELADEIYSETSYMALRDPKKGHIFTIQEMVNFIPLEPGNSCQIYPARGKMAEMRLERTNAAQFRVLYGEEAHELDLTVKNPQEPNYPLKHTPHQSAKGGATLTVLGRSNGFDPNDPANGYLIDVDGKLIMWDCPAYLNLHLQKMGVGFGQLDAMVLSHVHEDHIDVVESIRNPPLELYTTPEIYYSLMVKISAIFGCSMEEAGKYYHYHPVEPEKEVELFGHKVIFFHSAHAIPALGARFTLRVGGKTCVLHITGDHLSHSAVHQMAENGGMSPRRAKMLNGIIDGEENLILVDVGGGVIHGDYRDYLEYQGKGRIGFMHTGLVQGALPDKMKLVDSGEVWNLME